jgi:acyl dehydratase
MAPGSVYRTGRRTIAEADIVQFVNDMGFIEPLFMDLSYVAQTQFGRRIAPGLLALSVAEGLVIQTGMLHSTGLALLGLEVSFTYPTYVGDTLEASVEVTGARLSRSGPERGIVTTSNLVTNDRSETVIAYQVVRLVRGR